MKYVAVSLIAGVILKNISVKEMYRIAIKNLGRLTFSRKTSANVLKTSKLRQSLSNGMLHNTNFTEETTGNLAHKNLRRNVNPQVVFKKITCVNCLNVKKLVLNIFLSVLHFIRTKYDFSICRRGQTLDTPVKEALYLRDLVPTLSVSKSSTYHNK